MAKLRKTQGIVMAVLAAGIIAGCASTGTVKQLTPADAASLTGTWQGVISPPSGSNYQATMTVKPDGTYAVTGASAFESTGKLQIVNGHVNFVSTGGTGGLQAGSRSGSAVVLDRGDRWGLSGNGYALMQGPFNFDFNKTK